MFTAVFWVAAAERAIKTFAQVLLSFMTISQIGITHLPWNDMLDVAVAATVASVLTSLISGAKDGNPSATNIETTAPKQAVAPVSNVYIAPSEAPALPLPLDQRLPVINEVTPDTSVDSGSTGKHLA